MAVEGLPGKQVEYLFALLPNAKAVGVLINPNSPSHAGRLRDIESALRHTSIKLIPAAASNPADLPAAFDALKSERPDGVVVLGDGMFFNEANQILSLAAKTRMPAIHSFREHVERGGLISYGVSIPQNFRRVGYFVDRILKGAKAGDLPIELPTKLELVINLRAAKALGIEIPSKFLFTADEVIE
jgi:putative tryptophan/tyrosine transport system substrate-binding protein